MTLLTLAGTAEGFLRKTARDGGSLDERPDRDFTRLTRPAALALEMALHEETERRALAGELVLLEAAWREAEEIAAIADALPGDPPEPLRGVT